MGVDLQMERRLDQEDFSEFLEFLINLKALDSPVLGIAKLTIDKGWRHLSKKQFFRLNKEAIEPYYVDSCMRCGNEIDWAEMYEAWDNGQLCSYCAYQSGKD